MHYRTFMVFLLLALPVQIQKVSKNDLEGIADISIAFLMASVIALFWAFIAKWVRTKFASNLSDSYITKIQIVFALLGVLLTLNVLFNQS